MTTTTPPSTTVGDLAAGGGPDLADRLRRLARGRGSDPPWVRPSLLALLVATALLYLWGLDASGYANTFYSAAVQAATRSWKAMFFGSSDASNFITIDKPPASLWPSDLAARIFGLSPWTVLGPQALAGVVSVGVLYATVRRWFSAGAALLAGAILALTPVATLMFRFNNPDAVLVLLLVLGAYAVVRALERGQTGWLALAGACVGFGFLAKMLQALLVVPAFALAYLVAAPTSPRRRIWQLLVAGAAMVAAAGWWVAIVQLIPASSRPYIGGSQTNSVLELTFGYNGFGRITGNERGSVGFGNGTGPAFGGPARLTRLFGAEMGGQISWLLPAALILLATFLWLTRRSWRGDRMRAAMLLWGGWLLVTGAVFSYARGIIHPYYTVALAPAIGALVGIGAATLWRARHLAWARYLMAAIMLVTGVWSFALLGRAEGWDPWLAPLVLTGSLAAAALLLNVTSFGRRAVLAIAAAGLVVALTGPAAFALETAVTPHSGAIPSAGPAVAAGPFGPGGRGGGGGPGFGGRGSPFGGVPFGGGNGALPGVPFGGGQFGNGGVPGGAFGNGGGQGGALGGLLNGGNPSAELVQLLRQGSAGYTWTAAAVGSNSAAGVQIASGEPIMAIGGFNGTDPAPTMAQFQQWVEQGKIHYFLGGGGFGGGRAGGFGGGDGSTSGQIAAWVAANFPSATVGGTTVYDLSTAQPA
jgi:4-amino-4-deoxy-L-arabinose transferase-like glycosyltransferase